METTAQSGFSPQAFQAFLASRDEPDWVLDARRQAWDKFQTLTWPTRNDEPWSRTDIRMFKLDRFSLPDHQQLVEAQPSQSLLGESVSLAGNNTTLNSQPRQRTLASPWTQQGVLFGPTAQLLKQHPELLKEYFLDSLLPVAPDRFAALQDACWTGGHLLYVPRGVVVDQPLLAHSLLSDGAVDLGRTLVVLEPGAEATLMAESGSLDENDSGFHCGRMQLVVKSGAHLRLVGLQDWGKATWNFAHQRAQVERDASLQWTVAALGSRLTKVSQSVELVGPGAHCQVNGVLFTEGKQHIAYDTLQHHRAPHGQSDFLYKGALQDRSRVVWRGMIQVDPKAQRTDAYQRNDNLLLSPDVRSDSIPGLEIEADDVRCSHGSTSGRVDEALIFYAQCRGFSRTEAIRTIVSGFFQQIFDRVTIESVREALGKAIARRVRDYD